MDIIQQLPDVFFAFSAKLEIAFGGAPIHDLFDLQSSFTLSNARRVSLRKAEFSSEAFNSLPAALTLTVGLMLAVRDGIRRAALPGLFRGIVKHGHARGRQARDWAKHPGHPTLHKVQKCARIWRGGKRKTAFVTRNVPFPRVGPPLLPPCALGFEATCLQHIAAGTASVHAHSCMTASISAVNQHICMRPEYRHRLPEIEVQYREWMAKLGG